MAFKVFRNDITRVHAEAIVNTANPYPRIGRGTDTSVYLAAGSEELLQERLKIGVIERGHSAWTPAFKLEKNGVKYIIHTVGVHYHGGNNGEEKILRSCYASALKMASDLSCKSVAIPLLATGNYEFPKELALQIAIEEISRFLFECENEMDVFLVVYDNESYKISEKIFDAVEDFLSINLKTSGSLPTDSTQVDSPKADFSTKQAKASQKVEPRKNLEDFITESAETLNFQNTLQRLIANRNLDNAVIYKRAYIDKKFFSKIISVKDYVPKKHAVMALGLALELPISEYEDFLASAGYAFMPASKFDMIVKYCVINHIYNLLKVDIILNDHGEECFAPN